MASSNSKFSMISPSLSSNNTLQELAALQIINQYDSIEAIEAQLNSHFNINIDMLPVLNTMCSLFKFNLHLFHGHISKGQLREAEDIINANPKLQAPLLSYKGRVIDDSGRTIYGTGLQMSWGAKDVSIGKHEEMTEMIMRYLKQLPGGEEKLTKQYAEQFPEGYEEQEEKRKQNDLAALRKVYAAIDQSTCDEDCEKAIKEFHDYLKNQTKEVITTGYHFNNQLYAGALELYNSHYEKFGGFFSRKNKTLSKVIGGIQRYFPNCLAQAACDGFAGVIKQKKQLSRALLLANLEQRSFYAGVGESYVVYGYESSAVGCGGGGVWTAEAINFTAYVEKKDQTCRTYATKCSNEHIRVCSSLR